MRNAIRLQKTISDIRYITKIGNNMLTLNNERLNLTETILQSVVETRNQITRDKKNANNIYDAVNLKSSEKEKEKGFVIERDKEG